MKKILSLTIVTLLGFAASAHASTLISLGPTNVDVSYGAGGALTPNVDLAALSPAQLALTGDAHIINPAVTLSGQYKAPDGGAVFADNYLAVIANPTPVGQAVYNLGPSQHTLGFTWGSVDSYNTLTITASNATYVITGSNLAAGIAGALLGSVSLGSSDEDVIFNDTAGTILSATFQSSQNSFEVANFESAVPLPAALPLFGAALLGAGALARRRKAA